LTAGSGTGAKTSGVPDDVVTEKPAGNVIEMADGV
jgi:hypothetical protein